MHSQGTSDDKGENGEDREHSGKSDKGGEETTTTSKPKVPLYKKLVSSPRMKLEHLAYDPIVVDDVVENLLGQLDEDTRAKCDAIRLIDENRRRQHQMSREFLYREGLAAEMPSSLIPTFSGKAHIWAERVESIIKIRGVTRMDDPMVTQIFLPVVLSRLPPDIAKDAPSGNLDEVLAYLKNIDRVRYDLNQCFIEGRKLEKSPSQAFSALVSRARKALPPLDHEGRLDSDGAECTELHVKTVAWTSLKAACRLLYWHWQPL